MFDLIHKLRQKSEKTKTLVAFSGSLFIAGTIFLVWMTVVFPDIRQDKEVKDKIASIEPSPFSSFSENIAKSFSSIKDQFSSIKFVVSEFSANVIGSNPELTSSSTISTSSVEETGTLIIINESEVATSTTKIGE